MKPANLGILLLLALLVAAGLPGQTLVVYDDFTGSSLDPARWDDINEPNLSLTGGSLRVSSPPLGQAGSLISAVGLTGDFQVVLHWHGFQATATSFVPDSPHFGLWVGSPFDPHADHLWIARYLTDVFGPPGHYYLTSGRVGGVGQSGNNQPTSAVSGSFRISRGGGTITVDYDEGAGWQQLMTYPAFAGPVRFRLNWCVGGDGLFSCSAGSILYSGNLVADPVVTYGSGCAGLAAWHGADRWPRPGQPGFTLYMGYGPPGAQYLTLVGYRRDSWGSLTLPFALAPFGAPGCHLQVNPILMLPGACSSGGTGGVSLNIPADPVLAGSRVYFQWALLDPAANALGMAWSDGVAVTVQP